MKIKNKLMAPEEEFGSYGGGGGSEQAADVFTEEAGYEAEGEESSEVSSAGAGQQAQQPQQQQPVSIPLDQLPQLMQAFQQSQAQPQQAQQLTQEEIDARLKKVRVDNEMAAAFFGEGASEAQVKFLQSFVDSIVEHQNTVLGYALQAMQARMQEQFQPVMQQYDQQRIQGFTSSLVKDYPALKGREQLVNQVVHQLRAQGYQAATGEEAARVVAAQVEQLIKQVDPNFTLAVQQQNQQRQQSMPTMAGMPAGAGGQAGSGGKPKAPAWQGVFQ